MSSLWLGSKWKQRKEGHLDSVGADSTSLREKEKYTEKEGREKEMPLLEDWKEKEETQDYEYSEDAEADPLSPDLLFAATLDNDFETVEALVVRHKLDPNKKSDNGSTALHLAAWRGNLPIVLCLLENGADVNALQHRSGWTALHLALRFGHEDVASALIAAGASLDILDFYGCSSMTFAALGGKVSILQFLIAKKLDVNHLPKGNDTQALPPGYDCPPLHTACGLGNLEMVECLIVEGKADVNRRDSVQRTPLMYAVRGNHVEVVKFLLKHGAKLNLYDVKGRTAMHHATKLGNMELVDVLLDANADIYILDNEGLTPLDRLANDEDGSKRAHMVAVVEQRKRQFVQNIVYTSVVGLAAGAAIFFGGK